MDKLQKMVFNFFDMIYSGYKKSGKRPLYMRPPNVVLEYKNEEGRIAFEYHSNGDILNFNHRDFYLATNMFGVSSHDMSKICKEYAYIKLDNPAILTSSFYV